jgi:hypothetical protein
MTALGMRWRSLATAISVLAVVAAAPLAAQAGRGCEATRPTVAAVQQAMDLALQTAQALDASGADMVVLARAGQDLSRYGLRWSHLGLAYRDERGHWRVLHKLNACGSARGDLYRQGLGEFFLDDLFAYRAGWVVPTPALQAALRPLLMDDVRVARLHVPAYNMVAYPWATRYQQSNQWAIETLAWAADPQAGNRQRAQAWLRLRGYGPSVLNVSALERLGAGVGSAHITFDDHPLGPRMAGRIATVTVDSVFAWLPRQGLSGPVHEVGR